MAFSARIRVDRDFIVADVDPRLYGGFVEHLGRHIYTGIYEPEHPTADEDGFRQDVIDLVRELQMPILRYPGGNFVSGYRWEDGVGPRSDRPRRLDLAWGTTETNAFGTDEFVRWCRKVGAEPMLAVNLGTRGPEEAQALVEYCNHSRGTAWSDLRRNNGSQAPHDVRVWCLGNEMDGPWQMGHTDATSYGQKARIAGSMMRATSPGIETVLSGSSSPTMPTFGSWEWEALDQAWDVSDYLSIHIYFGHHDKDVAKFLRVPDEMGEYIRRSVALCDAVAAKRKSNKRMQICFDEWNVWYHSNGQEWQKWGEAQPLLEDIYHVLDAVVVGGMMIELINHCDRVRISCIAQVVNVIGPIMTRPGGGAWRQTIFHPFAETSRHGRGRALKPILDHDDVRAAVVEGPEHLTAFIVNRSVEQQADVVLDATGYDLGNAEAIAIHDQDLYAVNTEEEPDRVVPKPLPVKMSAGQVKVSLPPASWARVLVSRRPDA